MEARERRLVAGELIFSVSQYFVNRGEIHFLMRKWDDPTSSHHPDNVEDG